MQKSLASRILFIFLGLTAVAFGQGLGTINGAVTDPSGATMAGAKIVATEVDTGITRSTVTTGEGFYVLGSLRPTSYSLSVEAPGFRSYTQTGIVLQADATVTVAVKMEIGSATETLTVEAAASQVDTSTATISQVVDSTRIVELPLNGRNAAELTTLVAGAVAGPSNSADQGITKTFPVAVTASVNGTRTNQTSYMLDGVPNNELLSNVNLPFPMPDALQEFSVQTSNYTAEFGQNAGGVVNLVTRSGTNSFHGALFDYWRNGIFNARSFFATTVDPLKRQQYGATFGGPVIKNKLFFFGAYQGTNVRSFTGGIVSHVPTAANLAGDFSNVATALKDPLNSSLLLPGNKIPASEIDPAALKLAQTWLPTPDASGTVVYSQPLAQNFDEETTRVDYSVSDADRVAFRYFRDSFNQPAQLLPKNILTYSDYGAIVSTNIVLQETHIFSPSFLNDARFGLVRESDRRGPPSNAPSLASFGVQGVYPPSVPAIESIPVSGYWSTGTFPPGQFPRLAMLGTDVIRWEHAGHSFAVGGTYERDRLDESTETTRGGSFSFSGDTTGNALADFMSGRLRTFSQGNGTLESNRHNFFNIWAQDSYKINSRLTINYGVRWEPSLPWHDKYQTSELFFPNLYAAGVRSQVYTNAPPGEQFPGDPGIPADGRRGQWNVISPRFGFAYSLTGDGKTSIRGGLGMFYDARVQGWNTNLTSQTQPFTLGITLTSPQGPFSNPYLGVTNPFPSPLPNPKNIAFPSPVTVVSLPPSLQIKAPVAYNGNLTIERQVRQDWLVRVAYVGTHSSHLVVNQYVNPFVYVPGTTKDGSRLYNGYGSIKYGGVPAGNAFYNSFQVSLQKRLTHGFTISGNYTWSKTLDNMPVNVDASNLGNGGVYVMPINLPNYNALDKGPSDFNRGHVASFNYVWQIPGTQNAGSAMHFITEGWQLNGIISLQTGGPLTVTAGTDRSLTGVGADRANLVSTEGIYISGPCKTSPCVTYLNPANFATPAFGSFGNVGKGALTGPGIFNADMGLARTFRITEGLRLQFRGEYFNALNHANFNNPSTSFSSASFGQITGSRAGRIGQLALKLTF